MDNMPTDRPTDFLGRPVERVSVDNVWASPSTLHMRVTVWGPTWRYRHKYDVALSLDEVPREALAAIWEHFEEQTWSEDRLQDPLF